MITCREVVELLIDFLAGELPPEHQSLLEQHFQLFNSFSCKNDALFLLFVCNQNVINKKGYRRNIVQKLLRSSEQCSSCSKYKFFYY